jgi:protein TonB
MFQDCVVVSETPAGYAFGAATLRLAKYFRLHPATKDGKPIEGKITVPLHWRAQ